MRFAAPEYLWLLWVLVGLLALRLIGRLRRHRRVRAFAAPEAYRRLTAQLGGAQRGLRDALRFAAAAALVLALARPQFGQRLAVLKREGIDVMVAIDTSSSMLAEDMKPNRLEAAKRGVVGLIDRLRGDRIGIVVFAGSAFVQCPLTLDGKAARLLLDAVGPEIVPDPGTALGSAIERATTAFHDQERRFKALILFTDGEDTAVDPLPAARRAAEKGVRIFTVGVGTERGEPIPVRNPRGAVVGYKKDRAGEVVVSRLDEAALKQVAEIGHGRAFRASPAQSEIDALYAEIDAMEKREIEGGFHAHYEDRFHWFAVAAFVLLAAARLLGEKRRPPRPAAVAKAAAFALLLTVAPVRARADVASDVHAGNSAYARGKAQEAAEHYLRALEKEPERPEIQYNLGNALYAGRRYADAQAAYGVAATRADSALAEPLSYNLGNAFFREGKYAEAVAAYKQTLRRNPADEDARWNLEIALRKLEQQEQEQQNQDQQQDDKNQKQDNQGREQDQQQQQEQQRQDQQQNQQDQNQQDQDQQDQQQQQQTEPQQSGEQGGEEPAAAQNAGQTTEEMSAAEAARLLEALGNDERRLLQERFRSRGRRIDVEKDW
jgi:Ca-activated chloride channel family protein